MGEAQERAAILMATNAGAPFFSVREVGKGRTAAIAGDGLWAANFASVGAGRGNRAYQELVRRAIRWLVKDPAVGSIFFSGLRAEYNAASPVSFSVKASQVKKGSELCVKLINAQDRIVEQKRIRPARPGALAVEFRNPGEGAYVVQAEAVKGRTVEDYASESFSVSLRGEYGDGVNLPLLSALAEQSNGRLLALDGKDLAGRIDAPALDASRVVEERLFPLWNSVWGLCGLVLLFALEWFFRKRSGLL
jgi:hypothetical protein